MRIELGIGPLRQIVLQGLHRRRRFREGGAQWSAGGESLVEAGGELRGCRVQDGLGGGDHHRDSGGEERLDLPLGGAAIQEDQRKPPLLAQEPGEARGMDDPWRPSGDSNNSSPLPAWPPK